jgi:hypothetical protein
LAKRQSVALVTSNTRHGEICVAARGSAGEPAVTGFVIEPIASLESKAALLYSYELGSPRAARSATVRRDRVAHAQLLVWAFVFRRTESCCFTTSRFPKGKPQGMIGVLADRSGTGWQRHGEVRKFAGEKIARCCMRSRADVSRRRRDCSE